MTVTEAILAVQRMQDYIKANAEEKITPKGLSSVSYYSPWYSYRLFKALTGLTPADYVRRLRLSGAATKLKAGTCRIIDVALESGYESVDGFTRAFFREFGCTPREYAENPIPITLFVPYGVKYRSLRKENYNMENVKSVFVSRIEKPERKALVKRGVKAKEYFEYCGEVGCDIWGLLLSMDSLCGEPVCLYLPEKLIKPGTSEYVQGVEVPVDYSGDIPEGFDIIDLPAAEYLMFTGEPFEEEDYSEAIAQVKAAIKKFNPENIGFEWDRENPAIQLEPIGSRGYIELHPIKKAK